VTLRENACQCIQHLRAACGMGFGEIAS